ncbi:MAG: hypothetical protein ACI37Z_03435 [Candidatus Gastranaerophilaceae bacterium]
MSRSYKHIPYCGMAKQNKRLANKRVRRVLRAEENNCNHCYYKRLYDSWEICDYYDFCSWEEYWRTTILFWERFGKLYGEPFPDKKQTYREYKKAYVRK